MGEIKVKDLIEKFKKMDQEAIVCNMELTDNQSIFSSIEICAESIGKNYINDNGDEENGNIVVIF